ncbi:ribonuclease E inhibitor RraB [Fodinibius sediminis]|nr:ribonuclease E inhibitor RraB [Fodinibius sediminis]
MSHPNQAQQAAVDKINPVGEPIKEQAVDFFLYFPTEWDACVAASQLMNLHFSASVRSADSRNDQWLCQARKKLRPTAGRLRSLAIFLERLASGNNGIFDTWGLPDPE